MDGGMEGSAGGGLGFFHGIVGEKVSEFGDEARGGESLSAVVGLEVDIGIDLVGDAVVTLIAFESDIVSGGADRQRCTFDLERRFPYAQVIARSDDAEWFSVGPAVILGAAKEVERAHGHGQVGLFRKSADHAMENGVLDVSIDFHPAGGGEDTLHGGFGTKEKEINHVAGIAFFVADAARDLGGEIVIDAGKRANLPGGDARGATYGPVHRDAHSVCAVACVIAGLIDADCKAARDSGKNIAASAGEEGLSGGFISAH